MEFQRLLLQIGQALSSEEVRFLVFLCTDVSQRSLHAVERFSDLCTTLSDQNLLSPDRPELLHELLLTIQRPVLVRDIPLTETGLTRPLISPYRKLLYNLSENLTDNDLRGIKFLLNQKIPRRKLDESVTTLELFLEMEQMDLLGQTNLDLLQSILASVCPVLNEDIDQFKQQQATAYAISAYEEMNLQPSVSHPFDQNPHDLNYTPYSLFGESDLNGMQPLSQPAAQLSVSPPGASMDFPPGFDSRNCASVVSQHISDANAVTNNSPLETSAESSDIPQKPTLKVLTKNTNVEEVGKYPMTGAKRGFCLIINNYNFEGEVRRKREGTQFDQECLVRVFEWLGFQVEVHQDCSGEEMRSVAKELSRRDHRDMDCVVCCFLSHGLEGSIFGVDNETVSIGALIEMFNGSQCPTLIDKPKLFFIQACQGTKEQQAVSIQTDGPTPSVIESDAVKLETIPCDADFLLGMATVPSFVSYRDKSSGTWYIQSLCKNLIQMVPRGSDLISILTKVNDDVSQMTGYCCRQPKKQMPQPSFSLRRHVIFPVPSSPPPEL